MRIWREVRISYYDNMSIWLAVRTRLVAGGEDMLGGEFLIGGDSEKQCWWNVFENGHTPRSTRTLATHTLFRPRQYRCAVWAHSD